MVSTLSPSLNNFFLDEKSSILNGRKRSWSSSNSPISNSAPSSPSISSPISCTNMNCTSLKRTKTSMTISSVIPPNSANVSESNSTIRMIGEYRMGKIIGLGASSFVRSAFHVHTNQPSAIKITKKKVGSQTAEKEIAALSILDHPNVVPLLDHCEDESNTYLIMPHCQQTLLHRMNPHVPFSEEVARKYFRQLVSAVKHCHENYIVHRDIKLDNLLLMDDGDRLLLADFGLAENTDSNLYRSSYVGTFPFCAPEIFLGKKLTGRETDVWSMGICLYSMVTSKLPFESISEIIYNDYPIPSNISLDLQDLISKLLCKDVSKRVTIQQIENHPWLQQTEEELNADDKRKNVLSSSPLPVSS